MTIDSLYFYSERPNEMGTTRKAISKAERKTFGISFDEAGQVRWQFSIGASTRHATKITLMSWLDGCENETKTVTKEFLNSRCLLFVSHDDFLHAADYWSDPRRERRNEEFITG